VRRLLRNLGFNLAKSEMLKFVEDHEEDLIAIFREEMANLDDRIEEEKALIDIHMVPLGEEILRAVLQTFKRFLKEY
jgi:hypothetical protein